MMIDDILQRAGKFYIDGEWVTPSGMGTSRVVNPATEGAVCDVALGDEADVERAVAAASRAWRRFSQVARNDRLALLGRIEEIYRHYLDEFAHLLALEMGAPLAFARERQVMRGPAHLGATIAALRDFPFEVEEAGLVIRREPIGVCALITPWNWPLNQIMGKIAPALAAGCTIVLKPSELAPLNALLVARVMHEAGVPAGVFNLINGEGAGVGTALCRHPDIAMISFTGSTRAGIEVARNAAEGVKRIAQELGGKSANILLPDANFERAVAQGIAGCFTNSGQSCSAPTRMLVPRERLAEVEALAERFAADYRVGDPFNPTFNLGPVANATQFAKVRGMIEAGIREGAKLICGGLEPPENCTSGYFIRPTIFSEVTPDMLIAREEVFGPVLVVVAYDTIDQAIEIANDTPYGLAGYVQSQSEALAMEVGRRLQAGQIHINYPAWNPEAPFGGYKQSGNGREHGRFGIEEYLETKALIGLGRNAA